LKKTDQASAELVEQLRVRNAQLEEALRSRIVIEQAKGMLAERFRLGVDEAFALLREASRSHRIKIHALAATVVASETTPSEIERIRPARPANVPWLRDELAALRRDPVAGVRRLGETTVVQLAGELDLYTAGAVRTALTEACEAATGSVVVDLSNVEFLDSSAAGILLEGRSRPGRVRVSIAGAPPHIGRALDVCGVDGQLPAYPTLAAAISQPG
jgi:anti-anti-sigma factor